MTTMTTTGTAPLHHDDPGTARLPAECDVQHLVHLRAGHSRMLYCNAGTVVVALRGGLWLTEAPRWVGEHLLRPRHRLERHASREINVSGWTVLWAEGDAVLQVVPAAAEVTLPSPGPAFAWSSTSFVAGWQWLRRQLRRAPAGTA